MSPKPVQTGGVDHLSIICSNLEATIEFYLEVLGMRLTCIVLNRDDPTSTHFFSTSAAATNFPEHGPARTVRGVRSMRQVAVRTQPELFVAIIAHLKLGRQNEACAEAPLTNNWPVEIIWTQVARAYTLLERAAWG